MRALSRTASSVVAIIALIASTASAQLQSDCAFEQVTQNSGDYQP